MSQSSYQVKENNGFESHTFQRVYGGLGQHFLQNVMKSTFRKVQFSFTHTIIIGAVLLGAVLILPLPSPLFKTDFSPLLLDDKGTWLDARVANDQQWRFQNPEHLPPALVNIHLLFEDEYFYYHPGINPLSILRAARDNIAAGRIVSGGSTITMQVVRMMRGNPPRTWMQKLWEMLLAIKLEVLYSKEEIVHLYLQNAPYGGNIVGISTASWMYFNREIDQLSTSEMALLAVLPNSPGLLFPGKNPSLLRHKRNLLLDKMHDRGMIKTRDLNLALDEPLPQQRRSPPHQGYHLLQHCVEDHPDTYRFSTTIKQEIQHRTSVIAQKHANTLIKSHIYNLGILVADLPTGHVLAYLGNTPFSIPAQHQYVDMVRAQRSPGSLLKPFLYALSLDNKLLLPQEILPDYPMHFEGFSPQNFNKNFRGAIPADEALASSLNVPFVHLLKQYGYPLFYEKLKSVGIQLSQPADHYGVSLVLGGMETSLFDLVSLYRNLYHIYASIDHRPIGHPFSDRDFTPLRLLDTKDPQALNCLSSGVVHPTAIYPMLSAMTKLRRPEDMEHWERFRSQAKIAWKTGTSYGLRDAWAIGLGRDHIVGVWIGNANSTGRPHLIGAKVAAPVMFDIFNAIEEHSIQLQPLGSPAKMCAISGQKAGPLCPKTRSTWVDTRWMEKAQCQYHEKIFIDRQTGLRLSNACLEDFEVQQDTAFLLPPAMQQYATDYPLPPDWHPNCPPESSSHLMQLIYPKANSIIKLPIQQSGQRGMVVFHATHISNRAVIHWYLDNTYLGKTQGQHKIACRPDIGRHQINLMDTDGNEQNSQITVTH